MNKNIEKVITGLALFQAISPFEDYSGTIFDFTGEWNEKMIEAHSDEYAVSDESLIGLSVWEGICNVLIEDPETENEYISYSFEGKFRRPTYIELRRLGDNFMPLRNIKMPISEEDLLRP